MDMRMGNDAALDRLAAMETFGPLPTPALGADGAVRYEVELLESDHVVVGKVALPRKLTKKEAAILRAIFRRRGVATKEFLLQELYAGMDEPELKIIDVFTCKLRAKLGEHAAAIETVWGRGYVANPAYRLAEPMAYLAIDPDLRHRIDELALAQGCRADEMAAALLLRAVVAKEKETWS